MRPFLRPVEIEKEIENTLNQRFLNLFSRATLPLVIDTVVSTNLDMNHKKTTMSLPYLA